MNFFSKKAVGLEIADRSIEVVELSKKGLGFEVASLSRVKLGIGIVEKGRIKDEKRLLTALQKAFASAVPTPIKPDNVIFGLSESQTYLHVFELKKQNEKARKTAIQKEAERNIPIAKDNLVISGRQLKKTQTGEKILLAATSREVLDEWQQFFQKAKIPVGIFDVETLATFRGLFTESQKNPICVVDMGAAATQIAIFNRHGLQYTSSIPKAGEALTKEIVKTLRISEDKAEKIKKTLGLSNPEDQIFQILGKILGDIGNEIRSGLEYFKEKTGEEVGEIVLAGGSAQMKGIGDYFSTNLSTTVHVGKSAWVKKRTPLVYIQSIGLALRGLDKRWTRKDPVFLPTLKVKKPKKEAKKIEKQQQQKGQQKGYSLLNTVADKKIRRQKIILGLVAVLGIAAIVGAFWFRSVEKTNQEKIREQLAVQYTKTQEFIIQIPVAASEKEYALDRVQGRIIIHKSTAGSYAEALARSRTEVISKQLGEEERLWKTPVNPPEKTEDIEYPVSLQWLVYEDKNANDLFLTEVRKYNTNNVEFALNDIEKTNLESTENENIFLLEGKVILSLNEFIEHVPQQDEKEDKKETVENIIKQEEEIYVIISETTTGLLNVRKGPGVQFEAFMEVKPGDEYVLLEENGSWYKVKIDDEIVGWLSSYFAKKIKE